jgi:hypothetical protein
MQNWAPILLAVVGVLAAGAAAFLVLRWVEAKVETIISELRAIRTNLDKLWADRDVQEKEEEELKV